MKAHPPGGLKADQLKADPTGWQKADSDPGLKAHPPGGLKADPAGGQKADLFCPLAEIWVHRGLGKACLPQVAC